jgi:predicted Na+-dependent transporter
LFALRALVLMPHEDGARGLSGFHEILLIAALVLGFLYVPRFLSHRGRSSATGESARSWVGTRIGWGMRAVIVVSVLWPVMVGLYTRPWSGSFLGFVRLGVVPVLAFWGVLWIAAGFAGGRPGKGSGS